MRGERRLDSPAQRRDEAVHDRPCVRQLHRRRGRIGSWRRSAATAGAFGRSRSSTTGATCSTATRTSSPRSRGRPPDSSPPGQLPLTPLVTFTIDAVIPLPRSEATNIAVSASCCTWVPPPHRQLGHVLPVEHARRPQRGHADPIGPHFARQVVHERLRGRIGRPGATHLKVGRALEYRAGCARDHQDHPRPLAHQCAARRPAR
jgi:hypothetical protein